MYLAGNLVFAALRRKDTRSYEERPRRVSSEAFLQLVQVTESDGFLPELLAQPPILGGVSRVPFASRCPRTAASAQHLDFQRGSQQLEFAGFQMTARQAVHPGNLEVANPPAPDTDHVLVRQEVAIVAGGRAAS